MKSKRLIALILSTLMVLSQLSLVSFAADEIAEAPQGQPGVEQVADDEAQPAEASAEAEKTAAPEEAARVAVAKKAAAATKTASTKASFNKSKTVNGVKVTVKAAKGVFPKGSKLSVKKVSVPAAVDTEDAVETYAFDISILSKGKKIQPDGKAKVSFTTDEVADESLDTAVYHMNGKKAEKLKVQESDETATVTTTGFSTYVVTFYKGDAESPVGAYNLYYGIDVEQRAIVQAVYPAYADKIDYSLTVKSNLPDEYVRLYQIDDKYMLSVDKEWKTGGTGTISFFSSQPSSSATPILVINVACKEYDFIAPEAKEGLEYDGKKQELVTPGTAPLGTIVYSSDGLNWSESIPTGVNAGDYKVYYEFVDSNGAKLSKGGSLIATIGSGAPDDFVLPTKNQIYNGEPQNLVAVSKIDSSGIPEGYVVQYRFDGSQSEWTSYPNKLKTKDAGTYDIQYRLKYNGQSKNYRDSEVKTAEATIAPKEAKITPTDFEIYYGSDVRDEYFKFSSDGFIESDRVDFTSLKYTVADSNGKEYEPGDPVGAYTIAVSGLTDSNYSVTYGSGTMRVIAKPISIKFPEIERTYGHKDPIKEIKEKTEVSGLVGEDKAEDVVKITPKVVPSSGVAYDEYTADAGTVVGIDGDIELINDNYVIGNVIKGQITVVPAKENWVTLSNVKNWTYGEDQVVPEAESKFGSPIIKVRKEGDDNFVPWSDGINPVNAGTYEVRAVVESDGLNYPAGESDVQKLTINKARITVTGVDIEDKVYDGTNIAVIASSGIHLDGAVNDDDVSVEGIKAYFSSANVSYKKGSVVSKTVDLEYGDAKLVGSEAVLNNYYLSTKKNIKQTSATITPAPVKISWSLTEGDKYIEDGEVHFVTAEITGTIDGEKILPDYIEGGVQSATKAGKYTAIAGLRDYEDQEGVINKASNYQLVDDEEKAVDSQTSLFDWEIKAAPAPGPSPTPEVDDPVQKVIDMINALPDPAGADDADAVKAARDAYEALTDEQKKDPRLTDEVMKKLTDAEEAVASGEAQKAAGAVSDKIAALPDDPSKASASDVAAAVAAYKALSDNAKALITDAELAKLQAALNYPASIVKVKLKSAKAKKGRKAVAKWKKVSTVSGYQLYYKAKGVKARKVTITKASTVKKTVKKLKAGKKYKFKVRAYTKVEDLKTGKLVKVYGKWSNIKKAKAKK